MKATVFIISIMSLLTINGFSQNKEVKQLLKEPETRTEIFNAIMNDHELMMDFMDAMKENKHAMMMMEQHHQMGDQNQETGMNHDQMMNMMQDNPDMMQKMMTQMMDMCEKDTSKCSDMAEMMASHQGMMQMCMQKMKEHDMMDMKSQTESKKHSHEH